MKKLIAITIFITLLVPFFLSACDEPKTITIGMVPYKDSKSLTEDFELMRAQLEQAMGANVKLVVAPDYLGLAEDMKKKEVDIGYFGPFSYIASESEIDLEPLVVSYRKNYGIYYFSLIATRGDSDIETIDDLRDHDYAFVDKGSTSGYVIPLSMYISRNIDTDSFFSSVIFSGSHNNVALDVLDQKVDAGSMDDIVYDQMIHDNIFKPDDLRIIWKSEEIPGSPFVARADLNKDLKEAFVNAMIEMHMENPGAISDFDTNTEKYVECDSAMYNSIRNVAEILGDEYVINNFLKKK